MDHRASKRATLSSASAAEGVSGREPQSIGLLTWRVKRVREYVDLHFAHSITLIDLANVAGLSRMHFAAKFRQATGVRPHEFVLRRRVERSQEVLLRSDLPIVQIALDHGFETHSHYSAVFKRIVGEPPARWRALQKNSCTQRD